MLSDTLKWREDFKLTEVLQEEFPEDVFGNLGRIYGKDKEGHPVVYVVSLLLCLRGRVRVRVQSMGVCSQAR